MYVHVCVAGPGAQHAHGAGSELQKEATCNRGQLFVGTATRPQGRPSHFWLIIWVLWIALKCATRMSCLAWCLVAGWLYLAWRGRGPLFLFYVKTRRAHCARSPEPRPPPPPPRQAPLRARGLWPWPWACARRPIARLPLNTPSCRPEVPPLVCARACFPAQIHPH